MDKRSTKAKNPKGLNAAQWFKGSFHDALPLPRKKKKSKGDYVPTRTGIYLQVYGPF